MWIWKNKPLAAFIYLSTFKIFLFRNQNNLISLMAAKVHNVDDSHLIWYRLHFFLQFLLLPFRLLSFSSKFTVIPRLNISSVIGFRKGSNQDLYLKLCTWGKIELHKIVFFIDLTLHWPINILLRCLYIAIFTILLIWLVFSSINFE